MATRRTFRIRFTAPGEEQQTCHSEELQFSDDDLKKLKLFKDEVRALAGNSLFATRAPTSFGMNYDHENGLRFHAPDINDEAWDAAMLRLRRISYEEKSPHKFNAIRNIVLCQLKTDVAKAHFKSLKQLYAGNFAPLIFSRGTTPKLGASGILDGGEGPASILRRYMNAYDFHTDAEQRAYFEEWFKTTPKDFVRGVIYLHITEMMRAMLLLADFIDGVLAAEVSGD